MSEFPKMLYRAGGDEKLHGRMCETMIVDSAEEQAHALDDGYALTPAEAHGEKPEIVAVTLHEGAGEDTVKENAALKELVGQIEDELATETEAHKATIDAGLAKDKEIEALKAQVADLTKLLDEATAEKPDKKAK